MILSFDARGACIRLISPKHQNAVYSNNAGVCFQTNIGRFLPEKSELCVMRGKGRLSVVPAVTLNAPRS